MSPAGWVLMLASCGGITTLLVWCLVRVLRLPHPSAELHAPLDIETDEPD